MALLQNIVVAQVLGLEVVIMAPVLLKATAVEQAAQQGHVVLHLDSEQYNRNKFTLQFHSCTTCIP